MKRTTAPPGSPGHRDGRRRVERKTLILAWLVCLVGLGLPALAQTVYVSPNVPTDPDGPSVYLPWQVVRHMNGGPFYSLDLTIPGNPEIDGLHRMDKTDNYLFSVEASSNLGGGLGGGVLALPGDIVRYDAGSYSKFFDSSCVPGLERDANVNALSLFGGDGGDLVVFFDAPTDVGGGKIILTSEWAVYTNGGGGACNWTYSGSMDFASGATTTYFPSGARVTGVADYAPDQVLLSFNVPVDLAPPAPTMYLPNQIVHAVVSTRTFSLQEDLATQGSPGWPVSSTVGALACPGNPGRASQITLQTAGSNVQINCLAGCSAGAEVYGIYEGSLTDLNATGNYNHVQKNCGATCAGSNVVSPGAGDRYFLVVPSNTKVEGSYGLSRIAATTSERPQAALVADRCAEFQRITTCP